MKNLLILLLLCVGNLTFGKGGIEIELTEIELFEGNVKIKVPAAFKVMPEGQLSKYYTGPPKTKLAYANEDRSIRVGFGSDPLVAKEQSLPVITNLIENWLKTKNPKTKWKAKEVVEINGHKVGYIEFIKKKPEKLYQFVFFTLYRGQMLHCTFHAPKKGFKPWKIAAHQMMESLVLWMPEK